MRNDKWKRIAHRRRSLPMRKSAPMRKRMMCEGAKDEGDFVYDVLSSPNDDGEEFIDVG